MCKSVCAKECGDGLGSVLGDPGHRHLGTRCLFGISVVESVVLNPDHPGGLWKCRGLFVTGTRVDLAFNGTARDT